MNTKTILSKYGIFSSLLSNIGAIALFGMMALTVIDVAGRYLFNAPLLGAFELTEFLVLILIFSFLGYTEANKRHICVELILDLLPKRVQYICELINHVICLGLFVLITCMAVLKAIELMSTGESSPNLFIPNYPFAFFLALGSLVMCIEYIRDIAGLLSIRKENLS